METAQTHSEAVPLSHSTLEVAPSGNYQGWNENTQKQDQDGAHQETALTSASAPDNNNVNNGSAGTNGSSKLRWSWIVPVAIAVAVTALAIGGAVGGGLGAALSSCKSDLRSTISIAVNFQCQSATPTTSQAPTISGRLTDYNVEPAENIYSLNVTCDQKGPQTSRQNDEFEVHCGDNIRNGRQIDIDGNDVVVVDLAGIIAYSFYDCLTACSYFNELAGKRSDSPRDVCWSVTFVKKMPRPEKRPKPDWANCWLKNSAVTGAAMGPCAGNDCFSAVRQKPI